MLDPDLPLDPLHLPLAVDLAAVVVGALAGAGVAVKARFDVVGGLMLAVAMGLGGGILRDLLLGLTPVAITNQAYLPTVGAAAVVGLVFAGLVQRVGRVVLTLDALALGLFTVVGVEKTLLVGQPVSSAVFIGVCAAVGGGILVDVLSGQPVDVLRRGPWNATAALVGASLYVLLTWWHVPSRVTEAITITVVTTMRLVSLRWGVRNPSSLDIAHVRSVLRRRREPPAPV